MTLVQKTGSVGASWPPCYDQHNNRVKGFYLRQLTRIADARDMFATVEKVETGHPQATRTTVRAFVQHGLVEELRREDTQYRVEAHFSVDNALPGYELVYFGRNTPERMPDPEVLRRELDSVREIQRLERVGRDSAIRRVALGGYSLSRLNGNGQREVGRLVELYREAYQEYTFEMTPETVGGMLSNGNVVIVGREREAEIVSSLIAEHCELQLEDGRLIHLYELSDYATFREHRRNGLITLMQMEAIKAIRMLPHGAGSVIYAEDRAALEAVNRSSQKAGMEHTGTLLQHCVLVSDRDFGEQGRYENLNVWVHLTG